MAIGGCSADPQARVAVDATDNGYVVKAGIPELTGLCYAPQTMDFNPNLVIQEFAKRSNDWFVVPVNNTNVHNIDYALAADRKRIGDGGMRFVIEKSRLVQRPFYFQFVAFPCDAPRQPGPRVGTVKAVSVVADIEPYRYTRDLLDLANPP